MEADIDINVGDRVNWEDAEAWGDSPLHGTITAILTSSSIILTSSMMMHDDVRYIIKWDDGTWSTETLNPDRPQSISKIEKE